MGFKQLHVNNEMYRAAWVTVSGSLTNAFNLFFAFLKYIFAASEISLYQLVSVAEQAGFSLTAK